MIGVLVSEAAKRIGEAVAIAGLTHLSIQLIDRRLARKDEKSVGSDANSEEAAK